MKRRIDVKQAVRSVVETLEGRQFFAADGGLVMADPVVLDLSGPVGGPATVTAAGGTSIEVSRGALVFNAVKGQTSLASKLTIKNNGSSALNITGLTLGGAEAANFHITNAGGLPGSLAAGASATLSLTYSAPSTTSLGIHFGTLTIASSDATRGSLVVNLRGLATAGIGGQNEPSLQRLYELYQLGIATGDANAANTDLFNPAQPLGASDELTLQKLAKAGTGNVTIQTLGTFAGGSPAARFGWYNAGSASSKHELLTINSAEAQSVSLNPVGTTTFDPGTANFGLFMTFPIFGNTAFSEDNLNTTEQTIDNRRKVRFYPLKNGDGSLVPNAYVFTSDDFINAQSGAYDFNDFFGIIRNVKPGATASGTGLTVTNLDGIPYDDHLAFVRIGIQPPETLFDEQGVAYDPPPNKVHDTVMFKLTNSTSSAITINSLALSNSSAWKITAGPAAGTSLAPGASITVTVKFVATKPPTTTTNETIDITGRAKNANGTYFGTLTVNTSNSSLNRTLNLRGYYQLKNEKDQEPSLGTIVNKIFGYTTTILKTGQKLDTDGAPTAVGDEVITQNLRGAFVRADASAPVTVRQLASYHNQGDTQTLSWYDQKTVVTKSLFVAKFDEAQTILPHTTSGGITAGSFTPTGAFGFKVDFHFSEDSRNAKGHVFRFFPLRDRTGALVANSYIMSMDYLTRNGDYNDGVYIISNVKPAGTGGVVNPTGPTLGGLTLKNATTEATIGAFTDGASLDLSGGKTFTVQANTSGGTGTVASVQWALDGTVFRTDSTSPFTIAGEATPTDFNPWNVPLGNHTLTVTPFSGAAATGNAGTPIVVNFTAQNGTPAPFGITGLTLVNAATDADIGPITAGMTIDFSGGKTYSIRANFTGTTNSAVFKLDGATVRTESSKPFSIAGDNPKTGGGTDFLPWTAPKNGAHTLNVTGFDGTAGGGNAGQGVNLSINVTGSTSTSTGSGTFAGVGVNGGTGSVSSPAANAWLVKGQGFGLTGTKDQFFFAQQTRTGDFDIKAKLTQLTGGAAGLALRTGTAGGNSEVSIQFANGNVVFGSRNGFGAAFTSSTVGSGTVGNIWLRLKRAGSTLTAFFGTTGTTWTTAGSASLTGLAASANLGFSAAGSTLMTAKFEQVAG